MALCKTLYNATAAGAYKYEIIQLRNDFRRLDVASYWLAGGKSQFSQHLFFRSFGAFSSIANISSLESLESSIWRMI